MKQRRRKRGNWETAQPQRGEGSLRHTLVRSETYHEKSCPRSSRIDPLPNLQFLPERIRPIRPTFRDRVLLQSQMGTRGRIPAPVQKESLPATEERSPNGA